MKLPSVRLLATACSLAVLVFVMACGSKSSPAAPTPGTTSSTTTTAAPTLAVPALKAPTGGQQLDTLKPTLQVTNAVTTGAAGTVTYEFEVSEQDSFPEGSRTSNSGKIDQGGDGTTSWVPPSNLIPNFNYFWHARAASDKMANATDWSPIETFKTQNSGFFSGQTIFDPLTNGTSVASRKIGGHFVGGDNGGWQSDSLVDGLDYDIPTCASCKAEFDVMNFGAGEGTSLQIDVKWFSMGDAGAWGGFSVFRDHPWKMHLEQRSDGDGTGMQVIWRNGAADANTGGNPTYGDHRGKFLSGGPAFGHSYDNKVWHYVIEWTPTNYKISIGQCADAACSSAAMKQYFPGAGDSGVFKDGKPYAPGNHRIELGCIPRGESMIGARYRNFKLTPQ